MKCLPLSQLVRNLQFEFMNCFVTVPYSV
uniref:Uncharacterized protein n=1 Tax=Rhizophora mucronata TaxID=61149 RepID=A0A2P2NP90_RHIMU